MHWKHPCESDPTVNGNVESFWIYTYSVNIKKKKNPVNSAKLIIWHRVHTAVLNSNFEQLNIDGIVPEVSFYNGIYL